MGKGRIRRKGIIESLDHTDFTDEGSDFTAAPLSKRRSKKGMWQQVEEANNEEMAYG